MRLSLHMCYKPFCTYGFHVSSLKASRKLMPPFLPQKILKATKKSKRNIWLQCVSNTNKMEMKLKLAKVIKALREQIAGLTGPGGPSSRASLIVFSCKLPSKWFLMHCSWAKNKPTHLSNLDNGVKSQARAWKRSVNSASMAGKGTQSEYLMLCTWHPVTNLAKEIPVNCRASSLMRQHEISVSAN